jgi:hypothetical protein
MLKQVLKMATENPQTCLARGVHVVNGTGNA